MKFRIIYVTKCDKLSLHLENLVLTRGEEKLSVPLIDINAVVLEDNHTLFSVQLFAKLAENNILLVLCDEKHLPAAQLIPLHNYNRQTKAILKQIDWDQDKKEKMWQKIVQSKIHNQKTNCILQGVKQKDIEIIDKFKFSVENNDKTNREGLSAKKYFTSIFGNSFNRNNEDLINTALNYGYTILMSAMARTISSKGLMLPIGIHHKSEYNHYSLACDLMEPFRAFFDYCIIDLIKTHKDFDTSFKAEICNILNYKVLINDKNYTISDAIELFIEEFVRYMNSSDSEFDIKYFPSFIGYKLVL